MDGRWIARCLTTTLGSRRDLVIAALAALTGASGAGAEQDRSSPTEKGSLVVYPNVEVRWENAPPYGVIQDTFLHLANDFPGAVDVKLYFFNGDPPIDLDPAEWSGDERVALDPLEPTWRPPTDFEPGIFAREDDAGRLARLPAMEHGIAISIGLDPRCEGEVIEGTMTVGYNDDFGDSTEINDAFFTIDGLGGDRFPPAGSHLEIVEIFGNTNAVIGGTLPVIIGQDGSTLSGLPGLPDDGEVTFRITGYTIPEDTLEQTEVFGWGAWRDLCDEPDTAGCDSTRTLFAIAPAATGFHPRITLDKELASESDCNSGQKDVMYLYRVTNRGNVALIDVELTDDAPCAMPMFLAGDMNGNGRLDPANPEMGTEAETWIYQCTATVPGGTTSTAMVTATSPVGDCMAVAERSVTIGACAGPPRDHPGWNWADNIITLTGNEPCYWSAATGLPKGVTPWPVLDPGDGEPGRPDPDNPNERYLRGFVVAFAIQQTPFADEIRWNHLAGDATIVNYREEYAWQYGAPAFQVIDDFANGDPTGTPGELFLDGTEYAPHGDLLLLNFLAADSDAYRGETFPVTHDTLLTLMPLFGDFRQETIGPLATLATFDIWNENEVKFTNLDLCVTCWSSVRFSRYPSPNHFLVGGLHTNGGKVRIDGISSALCAPDEALDAAMIGVAARLIMPGIATGTNLFDVGIEEGRFRYDPSDPPPGSRGTPAARMVDGGE